MISFRHATVLGCTGADPVEDATVVIEGAVIKDVLTGARPAAGAGGEVIDCAGRTVMPGLIDAHVHVCAVEVDLAAQRRAYPASLLAYAAATMIRQALDQGFTTVRDAGGADWGMKEAVDRGLIPGPRMLVSGRPLSQSGGHGDFRTRAETDPGCGCGAEIGMVPNIADGVDEVRRAARTELRRGADAIKVMAGGGVASPADRLESCQYQPDEPAASHLPGPGRARARTTRTSSSAADLRSGSEPGGRRSVAGDSHFRHPSVRLSRPATPFTAQMRGRHAGPRGPPNGTRPVPSATVRRRLWPR
jgi:imidazolonepropionase-like amidohydrolase